MAGRPLSNLNDDGGPLVALAQDLRLLRSRAGDPTLESMSRRSGLSRTVLSEAMSGKKLPSEAVLEGFVRQCDGTDADVTAWLERRRQVLAKLEASETQGDAGFPATPLLADAPAGPPANRRGRSWLVAGVACVAVLAAASVGYVAGHQTSSLPTTGETPVVRTGADPASAGCRDDAIVGARIGEPDGTVLELVWSAKCQANWGRIIRTDNKVKGNKLSVTITGQFANAPNPITAIATDQQAAYTPIMVTGPDVKACVTGVVTTDGKDYVLPQPACA